MMKKKQVLVIGIFICLSLMLGACTSSAPMMEASLPQMEDESYSRDSGVMSEPAVEGAEESAPKMESGAGLGDADNPVERMVIYNADLQIAVENP